MMQQETREYLTQVVGGLRNIVQLVRDDTTDVLKTGDHIAVIRHYDALRRSVEEIKEARKALDEIEDHLSKEQVPDVMRLAGVKTITVEGVGRVTISNRFSCSMLDKEQAFKYLRSTDAGYLITETVNAQTLASYAKDLLENHGTELPVDIFKVGTSSYTSITKVK
jgi:hypothetical protein